jgi:hypothetical protein
MYIICYSFIYCEMLKTASILPKMAGPTCRPRADLLGMKILTGKYVMTWMDKEAGIS